MLRESGRLQTSKVTGLETEIIGEGEGFMGTIVRLRPSYDREEGTAPRTLIGKFPISLDKNRGLAEGVGLYEREIRFYRDLAAKTEVRTPGLYYSAFDANPTLEKANQIEPYLNRVPVWLFRLLLPLLTRFNSHSKRRYILLLEDLAPAITGNQVTGCNADVAEALVRNLAVMHAGWWQNHQLNEIAWLTRVNYLAPLIHKMIMREADGFAAGLRSEMPIVVELIPWLNDHLLELVNRLSEPPLTLLHGDYRLDNMGLLGSGADVKMTLFDWQTMALGRGPLDLAYFISGNLHREAARKAESQLVRAYHTTLLDHGVKGYDAEQCMCDYEISKLYIFYRMMAIDSDLRDLIDFGNERGPELLEIWMDRLKALIPQEWEKLLD